MCKAGYFFVFAITKIYLLFCKIWVYTIAGAMKCCMHVRIHFQQHLWGLQLCFKGLQNENTPLPPWYQHVVVREILGPRRW